MVFCDHGGMHGCCRVARVTLLLTLAGLLLVRSLLLLATSRRLLLKLQTVVQLLLLLGAGSSGSWPLLLNQAAAGTCRCLCLLQLLLLRHGRSAAHIGPNSSYVLLLTQNLQGTPCSRSRRRCLTGSTIHSASSCRIAVGLLLVLPAAWLLLLLLQHVLLCCSVCTL